MADAWWLLAAACFLGLAIYGGWIEPRRLVVRRLSLPQPGLKRDLRLVVMSDLQPTGPHQSPESLARLVGAMNAEAGDAVFLLGDFVVEHGLFTAFIAPSVTMQALGRLTAPLGVYAVLGNHDWSWNGPEMCRLIRAQDIRLLENEAVRAEADGQALWIAGLGDPTSRRHDLVAALAETDASAPTVLLSHTPDVFPDVPGSVALTLAGHTHGGQINLPFYGRRAAPSRFGARYAYGLVEEGGRRLFVTCGIGTSVLPVRFRAPPEIVVITLTQDDRARPGP